MSMSKGDEEDRQDENPAMGSLISSTLLLLHYRPTDLVTFARSSVARLQRGVGDPSTRLSGSSAIRVLDPAAGLDNRAPWSNRRSHILAKLRLPIPLLRLYLWTHS
jgi:hypothetical protein